MKLLALLLVGASPQERTIDLKTSVVLSGAISSRRSCIGNPLGALLSGMFIGSVLPSRCSSLSPEEASSAYDSYAADYNQLDGGAAASLLQLGDARSRLLEKAKGDVLEIGAGTGLNLDRYNRNLIKSLTLVDVSSGMLEEARKRTESLSSLRSIPIKFVVADATADLIDRFGNNAFDTVVDSFSLCVMGERARNCLDQVRRVAKDGTGRVLLLENSRSESPLVGLYQDATADAAASIGGKGCVYNQDVASLIRSTPEMKIVSEEQYLLGLFRAFECTVGASD